MDYSYLNTEALNCRCCGGVLKVKSSLCVCDYCGATNFISNVASKYTNQLNRANKLRQEREFDNAARIYDVILAENAHTADILWLRTLCEYGIEYVPDPVSDKYFPTLHRINDESILNSNYFVEALSLADEEEKESLQKEAEYIDNVQNEYLRIAENEAPYDVFICYKETDESTGEKTEDVELAQELYNDLTGRGYKVFFAKETLQTKLSVEYEPYIFAALKSSKAMIVLGTRAEYFMSVWVKNEWGRFLKLMQNDEKKQMFFACDDPENLPRAFANKQAQLLGDKDALKNLADNVEEFIKEKSTYTLKRDEMYERAVLRLNSGDKYGAKDYADKIIAMYPDFAKGYWLRMLIANNSNFSNVRSMQLDINSDPDYLMAVHYADEALKEEYEKTAEECLNNVRVQRDFNKIIREKSAEYVNNFDETEPGIRKNQIQDNLIGFASAFEDFFKRIRWSAAIGYILIVIGAWFFIFSNSAISDSFVVYTSSAKFFLALRIVAGAPFVLAGSVIMLSYNRVADVITTVICSVLLIISAVTTYGIYCDIAIILPLAVYIFTTYTKNKYREQMKKLSIDIKEELEDMQRTISTDAYDDMNKTAAKLLEQFKEETKTSVPLEIKEEYYNKELDKLNDIYEYAKVRYMKYVEVSFPTPEDEQIIPKKDSVMSIIAFCFSIVPILGTVLVVIDLLNDKFEEYSHKLSILSLLLSSVFFVLIIFITDITR